jgi:hypothetical protein
MGNVLERKGESRDEIEGSRENREGEATREERKKNRWRRSIRN